MITLADIEEAARRIAPYVRRTPLERSRTCSRLTGAEVYLKLENLQRTGSFKLRGALNKILQLDPEQRRRGVIAASAGNHAQGVAVAAALAGVPATIVMPRHAPLAKVAATQEYGARVLLVGEVFDDAYAHSQELARREGLCYVHPFDDWAVIAGQGTVALEMLADAPDLDALVVPVGGGGLLAGMAVAARALRPGIALYGAQATSADACCRAFHGFPPLPLAGPGTIADGIAVRAPGQLALAVLKRHVDDLVAVPDEAILQAIVLLLERAKLVAEGAGAVGLAALLAGVVQAPGRKVGVVVSGGNIDLNVIDRVIQHGLTAAGRYLVLRTHVPDLPGQLYRLAKLIADNNANILDVIHHRAGIRLPVNHAHLELTLETRDAAHGQALVQSLQAAGYEVEVVRA